MQAFVLGRDVEVARSSRGQQLDLIAHDGSLRAPQTLWPWARSCATTLSIPRFSRVRMPLVVRRSVTQRFSVSSQKRCVCRFGRKRRRFLLLAWETRLPTAGFFPVISQTRDIHVTLRDIRNL